MMSPLPPQTPAALSSTQLAGPLSATWTTQHLLPRRISSLAPQPKICCSVEYHQVPSMQLEQHAVDPPQAEGS